MFPARTKPPPGPWPETQRSIFWFLFIDLAANHRVLSINLKVRWNQFSIIIQYVAVWIFKPYYFTRSVVWTFLQTVANYLTRLSAQKFISWLHISLSAIHHLWYNKIKMINKCDWNCQKPFCTTLIKIKHSWVEESLSFLVVCKKEPLYTYSSSDKNTYWKAPKSTKK